MIKKAKAIPSQWWEFNMVRLSSILEVGPENIFVSWGLKGEEHLFNECIKPNPYQVSHASDKDFKEVGNNTRLK